MQQLTPLDTMFLMNESPQCSQHVTDILIFDPDGPGLSLAEIRELLVQRMHLLPPLRRRLVEVPFGFDEPYWVEDPEFDLDHHLHAHMLPSPGDDRQLAELAASIAERPLKRSRPLWELHLVHGLQGNRIALIKKFHHAALDGASSLEVTTILLDPSPEPRTVPPAHQPWVPDRLPNGFELMMRGAMSMAQRPLRMFEAHRRMTTYPTERDPGSLEAMATGWGRGLMHRGVPSTPLNVEVSGRRSVAFVDVPLSEIKDLTSALGVTVNDVVVSMSAGVLRDWLLQRDALPEEPLTVCIPISIRTEEERGSFGNRVSVLVARLPTHIADPAQRLRRTHDAVLAAKKHHDGVGANLLADMGELVMPAMQARLSRLTAAMAVPTMDRQMPWNLSISSLPGPRAPLYLSGHRLRTHYPIGMVMPNQALMITAASYVDTVSFGLVADPNVVPDLWSLADQLPARLTELQDARATTA